MNPGSIPHHSNLSLIDVDVLILIFDFLHVRDILSIRQVSKRFNSVSQLRTVWYNAFQRHVLEQDIPPPRCLSATSHQTLLDSLSDLTTEAIELLVLKTLYQYSNWRKPSPRRSLTAHAKTQVGRAFSLQLLRLKSTSPSFASETNKLGEDSEGRYALTAGYSEDNVLCLQVWDLDSKFTHCTIHAVGEWSERGRLFGLAVEDDSDFATIYQEHAAEGGALIAFCVRTLSTTDHEYHLRILRFNPFLRGSTSSYGLQIIKTIRINTTARVEALSGRRLSVRIGVDHNIGRLKVIDWETCPAEICISDESCSSALELCASQYGIDRTVLKVHFIHDWVLVFRETVVEFYFLPSWLLHVSNTTGPSSTAANDLPFLHPVSLHKWAWNVNSLSVTQRVSWAHDLCSSRCVACTGRGVLSLTQGGKESHSAQSQKPLVDNVHLPAMVVCACRYRPLSIVIRFESYFPWPVNLMHHYVLPTLPFYDPLPLSQPYLSSLSYSLESKTPPIKSLPFSIPPQHEHTIPSSVRLFSRADLVMGRYGTLVWLDSEAGYIPPTNTGAYHESNPRIYPSMSNFLLPSDGDTAPDAGAESDPPEAHFAAYSDSTGERIAARFLPLPNTPAFAQTHARAGSAISRALESTIGQSFGGSGEGTSLLGTSQAEAWFVIVANERAGRVVVGDREGGIEVWDYSG